MSGPWPTCSYVTAALFFIGGPRKAALVNCAISPKPITAALFTMNLHSCQRKERAEPETTVKGHWVKVIQGRTNALLTKTEWNGLTCKCLRFGPGCSQISLDFRLTLCCLPHAMTHHTTVHGTCLREESLKQHGLGDLLPSLFCLYCRATKT